jgi:hypothetical protein
MFLQRGVTSKRIMDQLSGISSLPVVINGYALNNTDFLASKLAWVDGSGGGTHNIGVGYDSYGCNTFAQHTENTATGNAYRFIPIHTDGFNRISVIHRCYGTAASIECRIGIVKKDVTNNPQATYMPQVVAGQAISNTAFFQALDCAVIASVNSPMTGHLVDSIDISGHQGDYYLYLESIATDGTSGNKYAMTALYNAFLMV